MGSDNMYQCPVCKKGNVRHYNHNYHGELRPDGSFEVNVYIACDNEDCPFGNHHFIGEIN